MSSCGFLADFLSRAGCLRGRLMRRISRDYENTLIGHDFEMYEHFLCDLLPIVSPFNFQRLRDNVLDFVSSMRVDKEVYLYRYSASTTVPNIYCSTYACMVNSLYGNLGSLGESERVAWIDYFKSMQSASDGLFRDPNLVNDLFEKEDWWGARHLAVQVICSLTVLGGRPEHDFCFLEPLYSHRSMVQWLESRDWRERVDYVGNEIMNYGALLQFSRDTFGNSHAGRAVDIMIHWLTNNLNSVTGMWSEDILLNPEKLSQAVQGAYHIFPLFTYDGREYPFMEQFVDNLLLTQNRLGGFGVMLNSSACEDIDTIEPLYRLSKMTGYRSFEIAAAISRAIPWIIANMNRDGGFVFRRNVPFVYGHKEMSSKANESSLFATWFRSLALAYCTKALGVKAGFCLTRCPGYEFG